MRNTPPSPITTKYRRITTTGCGREAGRQRAAKTRHQGTQRSTHFCDTNHNNVGDEVADRNYHVFSSSSIFGIMAYLAHTFETTLTPKQKKLSTAARIHPHHICNTCTAQARYRRHVKQRKNSFTPRVTPRTLKTIPLHRETASHTTPCKEEGGSREAKAIEMVTQPPPPHIRPDSLGKHQPAKTQANALFSPCSHTITTEKRQNRKVFESTRHQTAQAAAYWLRL